MILDFG